MFIILTVQKCFHAGVVLPEADYGLMDVALREACIEQGLQLTPYFRYGGTCIPSVGLCIFQVWW